MLNLYQSWDNSHDGTKYPFGDAATLLAVDGATALVAGVITDAIVGARDLVAAVYLKTIYVDAAAVRLVFGQGGVDIAEASVDALTTGWVALTSKLGVLYAGKIKISNAGVGALFNLGSGVHSFDAAATALVPYAVFLSPAAGVRGIELPDGTVVSGDITVSIGSGLDAVVLSDGSIRIDAIGKPFVKRDDVVALRRPIRVIDVTALSAGGAATTVTLHPLRGAITLTTDNADTTKSPAVAINGHGSEVGVEVAS